MHDKRSVSNDKNLVLDGRSRRPLTRRMKETTTRSKLMAPALGARITTRKKGSGYRFAYTAVTLMAIPVILGLSLVAGPLPWWWANLAMGVFIVLGVITYVARTVYKVVAFHEHAAVERVFSRVRVLRYDEVKDLGFEVVRLHVNRVHVGTVVRMRLVMDDGRKLRMEWPYEGEDDRILIVRKRIAMARMGR